MAEAGPPIEKLPSTLNRVLVVMHDHHLGNFVLALPTLHALSSYFDSSIDLLVDERYAPLVRCLPHPPRILTIAHRSSSEHAGIHVLKSAQRYAQLACTPYDVAIDLMKMLKSIRLMHLIQADRKIALEGGRKTSAYQTLLPQPIHPHCADRYEQFGWLTGTRPPRRIALSAPHAATATLETQWGLTRQHRWVLIHPTSGKDYRCWPAERFAAVADALAEQLGQPIILVGSPSEQPRLHAMRQQMQHHASAQCVAPNIVELLALIEGASVMVANESGPTHLAMCTNTPVVTLFGPSRESEWLPVRQDHLTVLRGATCDSQCHPAHCLHDYRCLTELTSQAVIEAALQRAHRH